MTDSTKQKFGDEVEKVANAYGRLPLSHTSLDEAMRTRPDPGTVLAMMIDALVKSRPISHQVAESTVAGLIEDEYHDIDRLLGTTWEERTNRLRVVGYNRYREQCASNLGALCDLVLEKYDGDLNNLLEEAHEDREEVRTLVKEFKGIGELGAELFLDNVQSIWPSMAPFIDSRSLRTAEEIGLGSDVSAIYEELQHDPLRMSRFVSGLSDIRLEHKQHEIDEL